MQARLLFVWTRRRQSMIDKQERLPGHLRRHGADSCVESPLEIVVIAYEGVRPHPHGRGEHQGILQAQVRSGEQLQRNFMHAGRERLHGNVRQRSGVRPRSPVLDFRELRKAHGRAPPRQVEEPGRARELIVSIPQPCGDIFHQHLVVEQVGPRIIDLPDLLVQRFGAVMKVFHCADVDGRIRVQAKKRISDEHRSFRKEQAGSGRVAGFEPAASAFEVEQIAGQA